MRAFQGFLLLNIFIILICGSGCANLTYVTPEYLAGINEQWGTTYTTNDLAIGKVYRLKSNMLLYTSASRGRYNLYGFGGYAPDSIDDYMAHQRRYRGDGIVGVVLEGTFLYGERPERYTAALLTSGVGWFGVTCRIMTGEHAGKLITPTVPIFEKSWFSLASPDSQYLEPVDLVPKKEVEKDTKGGSH